jgi:hypothetical protein
VVIIVPSPAWLFPKRVGPREAPVFNHAVIPSPGAVHQYIESTTLGIDASEQLRHVVVIGVVAADPHDARRQRGLRDRASAREYHHA